MKETKQSSRSPWRLLRSLSAVGAGDEHLFCSRKATPRDDEVQIVDYCETQGRIVSKSHFDPTLHSSMLSTVGGGLG